ncbi:hypothetical protein HDU96_010510 [Phlyctochytrium bullatum]|nr:hypothetical protein HDU96_010510 [Phlyctochytrium bullatum]
MLGEAEPINGTVEVLHVLHWACTEAVLFEPSSRLSAEAFLAEGAPDFCKFHGFENSNELLLHGIEASIDAENKRQDARRLKRKPLTEEDKARLKVTAMIAHFEKLFKASPPVLKPLDFGSRFSATVMRAMAAIDAGAPMPAIACAAEAGLNVAGEKEMPAITAAKDSNDLQIPSVKTFETIDDTDSKSSTSTDSVTLDGVSECLDTSAGQLANVAALDVKLLVPPADEPAPSTLIPSTPTAEVLLPEPTPEPAPTKVICHVFSPNGTVTTEMLEPSELQRLREASLSSSQPANRPALPTPQPRLQPPAAAAAATPAPAAPVSRNPFRALKTKIQTFTQRCLARVTRTA